MEISESVYSFLWKGNFTVRNRALTTSAVSKGADEAFAANVNPVMILQPMICAMEVENDCPMVEAIERTQAIAIAPLRPRK